MKQNKKRKIRFNNSFSFLLDHLNMIRPKAIISIFLIFAVSTIFTVDSLAVMSIDLGTEFMKIAIVKPGIPMEIALNK